MPVLAARWLRRMRGGAQAQLIQASDGHHYVVKCKNNPQHPRILINEWLASVALRYLGIQTPPATLVGLTEEFLAQNEDCRLQLGRSQVDIEPGWHFGSRFPGDPQLLAVFDFLPDALLDKVANIRDYLGALVFDKWTSNADARQSIFYRANILHAPAGSPVEAGESGFVASMIDNGFICDGPNWTFSDAPLQGLYHRRQVYQSVRGWENWEPWLDRVENFPDVIFDDAMKQIPSEWIAGDEGTVFRLCEQLLSRRRKVRRFLEQTKDAGGINLFANWR